MGRPLTRRELDAAMCSTPGCDHTAHDGLILKGRCHPAGLTLSEYRDGILTISCACGRLVTQIAVKDAPDSPATVSWGDTREKSS